MKTLLLILCLPVMAFAGSEVVQVVNAKIVLCRDANGFVSNWGTVADLMTNADIKDQLQKKLAECIAEKVDKDPLSAQAEIALAIALGAEIDKEAQEKFEEAKKKADTDRRALELSHLFGEPVK